MTPNILHTAYIALGANLGEPHKTFKEAIHLIERNIGKINQVSDYHSTLPLPTPEQEHKQPDYLNSVLSCTSNKNPHEILEILFEIEKHLGRKKDSKGLWESRLIDLDLIAVDNIIIDSEKLKLPHPHMHKRDFVLYPLYEINKDFIHPVFQKTIEELIEAHEESDWPKCMTQKTTAPLL